MVWHAPDVDRWPLCGVNSPNAAVAEPGGKHISCLGCLRKLYSMAQYANKLRAEGYRLAARQSSPRAVKQDPRQRSFCWE